MDTNQNQATVTESKADRNVAAVLMPNEHHILSVHQHIFILIKYYFFATLACILFLAAAAVLLITAEMAAGLYQAIITIVAIITVVVFGVVFYVITMAYRQTVLAITNCSVVQILQKGLLFHKVSRLSMADVEDVSSEQRGILTRVLGFGTMTIQTAGEMPNFIFENCPNPVHITEIILKARDQYNETNKTSP